MNDLLEEAIELEDAVKLSKILNAGDELGVVLRGHILVEELLNDIIDNLVIFPEQIPNLRYEQRVKLCAALGLNKRIIEPMLELGRIRNAFSHKTNISLSHKMVNKLFNTFQEDERKSLEERIKKVNKMAIEEKLLSMDANTLFTYLVAEMWVNLKIARQLAIKRRKKLVINTHAKE